MRDLLLCVDVGNTQTVLGIYRGKDLVFRWRIRSDRDRTADEYRHLVMDLLRGERIEVGSVRGVSISCVVPPSLMPLVEMARSSFSSEPLVVGPGIRTGMPILYDNPREVGADRIVNSVAAWERFRRALVVIDFGTAITLDVVSGAGEYMGGVIFPGIMISLDALFLRAARLPRVELERPAKVIGRDTVSSIQSGIIFGYSGLVDNLVDRISSEMGTSPHVVATGGLATVVSSESRRISEVLPDLTLEGLRILYDRNSQRAAE